MQRAGQVTAIDLWQYFDDVEDGPELTYAIVAGSITDPAAFSSTPTIDGDGYLHVQGVGSGTTQVAVSATDADGASVAGTFLIAVPPPRCRSVDHENTGRDGAGRVLPGSARQRGDGGCGGGLPMTGGATLGDDYQLPSATRHGRRAYGVLQLVAPGEPEINVPIQPVDDTVTEGRRGRRKASRLRSATRPARGLGAAAASLSLNDDENGAVVYVAHVQNNSDGLPPDAVGAVTLESIGPSLLYYVMADGYRGPNLPPGSYYVYDAGGNLLPYAPPATSSYDVHFTLSPGTTVVGGAARWDAVAGNWVVSMSPGVPVDIPLAWPRAAALPSATLRPCPCYPRRARPVPSPSTTKPATGPAASSTLPTPSPRRTAEA